MAVVEHDQPANRSVTRPLSPEIRETVVMVHGTFASDSRDEGSAWWQIGSECNQRLSEQLPPGVKLAQRREVFHWSGKNSERARIRAGRELLERLEQMEARGTGYHLIGHSHGGSVIWNALRESTLRSKKLNHLRSWSTVGTPFLHFRSKGTGIMANLVNLALALLLLRPALWTLQRVSSLVMSAITGTPYIRSERPMPALVQILDGPMIMVLELLGVPVTRGEHGLVIGSFEGTGSDDMAAYLFGSWEGWVLLITALLYIYVLLNLAVFFISPVVEWLRLKSEGKLEKKMMQWYAGRWLGLWSREDEAIGGLRATLQLTMTFVARVVPREPVLWSDYLALVARPYQWIWIPTFNSLFRPVLDRTVRGIVIKRAQGNNRPAAEIVEVSPVPFAGIAATDFSPLPVEVDDQIIADVNRHSALLAPKVRKMLTEQSILQGLDSLGPQLSGSELVHTSYFDNADVLRLLAMHIAWGHGNKTYFQQRWSGAPETQTEWLCQFKQKLGVTLRPVSTRRFDPPAGKIRPHRREDWAESPESLDYRRAA